MVMCPICKREVLVSEYNKNNRKCSDCNADSGIRPLGRAGEFCCAGGCLLPGRWYKWSPGAGLILCDKHAGMTSTVSGSHTITGVSRGDIIAAFADTDDKTRKAVEDSVKLMTDDDMRNLASRMASDYLQQLYWQSLRTIFEENYM